MRDGETLSEALARLDAEQAALPKYGIKVTPGAVWGWWAEANTGEGRITSVVNPPLFWRPTREGAARAANRRIRRWERQDARHAMTETITPW